jgi:tetratricopeptide (TPR) repeat protein
MNAGPLVVVFVPLVAVLVVFSQLLEEGRQFTNLDDLDNYNAHFLRVALPDGIRWCLFDGVTLGVYEPASNVLKLLIAHTVGISAASVLATNFMLHSINSCLVPHFWLRLHRAMDQSVLSSSRASLISVCATLASVHPICVEAIAWSSCLPYLLACCFSLLALECMLTAWIGGGSMVWRGLALCFFCLACSSKAAAISLAAVVCLGDALHMASASSAAVMDNKQGSTVATLVKLAFRCVLKNLGFVVVAVASLKAAVSATSNFSAAGTASAGTNVGTNPAVLQVCLRASYFVCNGMWKLSVGWSSLAGVDGGEVMDLALTVRQRTPPLVLSAEHPTVAISACLCVLAGAWLLRSVVALLLRLLRTDGAAGLDSPSVGNSGCIAVLVLAFVLVLAPTLGLQSLGSSFLQLFTSASSSSSSSAAGDKGHVVAPADRYLYLPVMLIGPALLAAVLDRLVTLLFSQKSAQPAKAQIKSKAGALSSNESGGNLSNMSNNRPVGSTTGFTLVLAGMCVVMLALGTAARTQTRVWSSSETLWKHVVAVSPADTMAMKRLGLHFMTGGALHEAKALFERAVALEETEDTYVNLGLVQQQLALAGAGSSLNEAEASLRKAMSLKPDMALAMINLGNVIQANVGTNQADVQTRVAEAREMQFRATQVDPNSALAWYNLGALSGDEEAIACYRRALAIQPAHVECNTNLGTLYHGKGQLEKAIEHYEAATKFGRGAAVADAFSNMGLAKASLGAAHHNEAEAAYAKAIKVNPIHANALVNMAQLMLAQEAETVAPSAASVAASEAALKHKKFDTYKRMLHAGMAVELVKAQMGTGDISAADMKVFMKAYDPRSTAAPPQTLREREAIQFMERALMVNPRQEQALQELEERFQARLGRFIKGTEPSTAGPDGRLLVALPLPERGDPRAQDRVISVVAFDRPQYFKQVLQSIRRAWGSERYEMHHSCWPLAHPALT